jgi:hypothetical protein
MESTTAEVRERAEVIRETLAEEHEGDERFRSRVAITISVLAILLAVSSFNTASYVRELINTNIHANSDETLFHIKSVEQASHELAADELRVLLSVEKKRLSPDQQAQLQREINRFETETARLESDPESGDGKKELKADIHRWQTQHEHAEEHLISFESADIIYQIAIVLSSVCIVLKRPRLFHLAMALGIAAIGFMLNGFFLWVRF